MWRKLVGLDHIDMGLSDNYTASELLMKDLISLRDTATTRHEKQTLRKAIKRIEALEGTIRFLASSGLKVLEK